MNRVCDLGNTSVLVKVIIAINANGGGIILTVLSFVFLFLIKERLDSSLREILMSFQVANLLGCTFVTYDTITIACEKKNRLQLTSVFILLTLVHLSKLLIAEHAILKSSVKRGSVERFKGLIFTFWLLSVAVGLLHASITIEEYQYIARIIFSVGALVYFVIVICIYLKLIKKKRWIREQLIYLRKKQVDQKHRKNISLKEYGELKYIPAIFISYIATALPWVFQHLYEGFTHQRCPRNIQFVVMIILSFTFYALTCVLLHAWKSGRKGKKIAPDNLDHSHGKTESSYIGSYLDFASIDL